MNKPESKLDGLADARRLQLLIDAIVDYAIYMIDVDGTVRSWNSGAERLKGYSANEVIGKSFSSFYWPEDRAKGLPQTALRGWSQAKLALRVREMLDRPGPES